MAGHVLGAELISPDRSPEGAPESQPGINEKSNIVIAGKCDFNKV